MSSREHNPLGPDFARRVLMAGDAREVILKIRDREISSRQVNSTLTDIARERGYDLRIFSEVFLQELEKKRVGLW